MIPDGATIMFGGFLGCGSAHKIIDALSKSGKSGFTIIGNDCGMATGPDGDLYGMAKLVHNKQVKRVIATHVGMTPDVATQNMVDKTLEVNLIPQGSLAEMIRAGGAGLGGCYVDSATSFAFIRGGHVNATILGGLEVDQEGSLSNWIIPGKKMPGMGGAMDLLVGAKTVIVAMEHTAKGKPKILKKCTLPYTAVHCITKIITEMCVMEVTKDGLVMTEINPEFTVDDVKAATEADFTVAEDLKDMTA